jgi:anti-anti-sigma regulatory factor
MSDHAMAMLPESLPCAPDATPAIALPRELTIYQVGALAAELATRLASGDALALDAADVVELDCAGVQLLLALRRHALAWGRSFSVVRPSAEFSDTVALLGLDLHTESMAQS